MTLLNYHIDYLLFVFLMSVRLGAFFASAPLFSDLRLPAPVRVILPMALAFILAPWVDAGLAPRADTHVVSVMLAIANEALVGVVMGFSVHLLFMLANVAGELAGLQSGFSIATMFDPSLGHASLLSFFLRLLLVLMFFMTDMHHVFLRALMHSYSAIPPGSLFFPLDNVLAGFLKLFDAVYYLAFRFALPVILAIFLAHILVGIVSVTAPQMNFYFNVALSFNVIFGLTIIGLCIGMLFQFFQAGAASLNDFLRYGLFGG